LGTKKNPIPPHPPRKRKNLGLLGICCNLSLADQNSVIPFQVWHLGSELFIILYFKIHFDSKKKLVYENLAIKI
jgi:hypothetical protein